MPRLHDPLPFEAAVREPPYRDQDDLDEHEREVLRDRLGDLRNNNPFVLCELARRDPRWLAALLSPLLSAEFRGVDVIGRLAVECRDVPWNLTLGLARQAWDEARHVELDTQLLEGYGSRLGEYPDRPFYPDTNGVAPGTLDPAVLLRVVHLALEGFALSFFDQVRAVARETGQHVLDRCLDHNIADETMHVALGDYWQSRLSEGKPEVRELARLAQELAEVTFEAAARAAEQLAAPSAPAG